MCKKKGNEVVTTENPLSAMRSVRSEFVKAEQKAKNLIESITKDDFFAVKSTIKLGNVKNEIEDYIQKTNPDFIILGKKQKRFINLNGDNVTDFIQKKYTNRVFTLEKSNISDVYSALNNKTQKGQTAYFKSITF